MFHAIVAAADGTAAVIARVPHLQPAAEALKQLVAGGLNHWQWFIRIVEQRKLREGDPVLVVIANAAEEARQAAAEHPGDTELIALRDWLTSFHDFVRLFDRSIGIVPQLDPRQLERALRLIGRVPDETAFVRQYDPLRQSLMPTSNFLQTVNSRTFVNVNRDPVLRSAVLLDLNALSTPGYNPWLALVGQAIATYATGVDWRTPGSDSAFTR